jgi:oxygen-independent coproporphyrinogen-3 oxidase
MRAARDHRFKSVSVDLICGLPHQSVESFTRTLDAIIALAPDRVSVFGYAHMPALFKMQRQIDEAALPTPAVRLAILKRVIERMSEAGYVYIGMDHFALPGDELARAQQAGTLQRNFQGYSTHADCDLIGIGASAIGKVDDVHAQNARDLSDYAAAIDAGQFAIRRGVRLTADDRLRRDVIMRLMCGGPLRFADIERAHGVAFQDAFADELARFAPMAGDGLIDIAHDAIRVLPAGRMLVRNVASVFDRYLGQASVKRFSRTI